VHAEEADSITRPSLAQIVSKQDDRRCWPMRRRNLYSPLFTDE